MAENLVRGIRQGDTVQYWLRSDANRSNDVSAQANIGFGVEDPTSPSDNLYYIRVRPSQDDIDIRRKEDGSNTTLDTATRIGYQAGEWWLLRLTWGEDNEITAQLFDENRMLRGEVSATDAAFAGNDGTVAWHGWVDGGTAHADALELVTEGSEPPTNLSVVATTNTSVDLTWDHINEDVVDEFNVYVGNTIDHTTEATSTSVGNLTPANEYSFAVTGVIDGSETGPSNTVTAATSSEPESSGGVYTTTNGVLTTVSGVYAPEEQ